MLDHLTDGRLEMGVVSGIPPELAVVGIAKDHAAAAHAETLDLLQSAITKPLVTHHGDHFSFDDIRITPSFLQSAPSVWTASTSAASARRAGERGLKVCSGFVDAAKLAPVFEAYQEGAKSAGMPTGPDRVAIRRAVTIVADESQLEKANAAAVEGVEEFSRVSFEAMKIPDAPALHLDPDELIVGTPDQVADEIIRQCTIAGAANFLAMFNVFDADQLRMHHELFGREVIPKLRAAQVG